MSVVFLQTGPEANSFGWKDKAWGRTRRLALGPSFEVHELSVNKGGFSSKHRHRKFNMFSMRAGQMTVSVYDAAGTGETARFLESGQTLVVFPGIWHRFKALTDCELTEIYWVNAIDPEDIERADQGGCSMKQSTSSCRAE